MSGASFPPGRTMVQGVAWIGAFAALAGAMRLGQDMAIAWRYGTGPEVDAYNLLLGFAQWPATVALSTLTVIAGPAEATYQADPSTRERFRAELLGLMLVVAALVLPAVALAMALATGPATGLAPVVVQAARLGLPAMAAMAAMGVVAALLAAWWVADNRHVLTLVEACLPAVVLACAAALPARWLFEAAATGMALQLALLAVGLRSAGGLPRPRLGQHSPAWHGLGKAAVALVLGQMLFALTPLVDVVLAAPLGEGQLAALGYASRLLLGVLGLVGLALQRAGLPLLSRLAVDDPGRAVRLALRWAWRAAGAGLLLGLVLALLAEPLVQVLYERGRFGATDRDLVVAVWRAGLLQLPPYFAGLVLVTALAATRAAGAMAWLAAAGFGVKVVASVLLVSWLGSPGLTAATALVYASTAWLAARALVRRGARA